MNASAIQHWNDATAYHIDIYERQQQRYQRARTSLINAIRQRQSADTVESLYQEAHRALETLETLETLTAGEIPNDSSC